jgi:hypothetical protein
MFAAGEQLRRRIIIEFDCDLFGRRLFDVHFFEHDFSDHDFTLPRLYLKAAPISLLSAPDPAAL